MRSNVLAQLFMTIILAGIGCGAFYLLFNSPNRVASEEQKVISGVIKDIDFELLYTLSGYFAFVKFDDGRVIQFRCKYIDHELFVLNKKNVISCNRYYEIQKVEIED